LKFQINPYPYSVSKILDIALLIGYVHLGVYFIKYEIKYNWNCDCKRS